MKVILTSVLIVDSSTFFDIGEIFNKLFHVTHIPAVVKQTVIP